MILCGIDLGTQSCKVALYDSEKHEIVAKAQEAVALISENDGTREQKAEWYDAALEKCFAALDGGLKAQIKGIGVSGHQHSLVPLDAEGKALYNVKMWNDTATLAECAELTAAMGGEEALIAEQGLPMRPGYTAPKVLWLKNHKPEAFNKLAHILLSHDYINYLLTGNYVAEYGDGSGTALFDVRKRVWAKRTCDTIGPNVFAALPELHSSEQPAGKVSAKAAARFGIPEGALVAAGGGDNMMAAIGTGTVANGALTMSLGTSGTLYGYSDKPVIDPTGGVSAFCSSTGGWLPLHCSNNCTVASENFRALFGLDVRAFDAEAEKAPAGSEGVIILPYFDGERNPNLPHGKASLMGMNSANFNKANIARAALESAIFGLRFGLESFQRLGFQPASLNLTGGGAKSKIWQRIAANVMKLPVIVPDATEAAAMGGAIQALWTLQKQEGRAESIEALTKEHIKVDEGAAIKPDAAESAIYDNAYAEFIKYLDAVKPMYL
ncbi:MAG: xylulokinase [Spirochaetaceae bacterium]|nr:xylulokinase [Spirochaetaceae bacterium]